MALRDAILRVQVHAKSAGAQDAPDDPTEGAGVFPFSVCYPNAGTIEGEAVGARKDLIDLYLDYHLTRQNLPVDVQAALAFLEAFPSYLINDPTLNGTVDTILIGKDESKIRFVFGKMEYAGQETIGFRFTIPVKLRRNI